MKYKLPDFTLDLPEGSKDCSIYAFLLTSSKGNTFNVTVRRHYLSGNSVFTKYINEDITARMTSGENYDLAWKKKYYHEGREGIITAGTLKGADTQQIDERRLYLFSEKILFILTAFTQGIFTTEQLDTLNHFVKGFSFDRS
ncbi:hypothetical protein [Swingsia samuiensis]|uniref:DUF1795 domain-containing protein n=1 Tax=Swingsia samuiensis TaxID=1293412 RepID=A0A4Y6UL67_9PROT|nr:hypothetical protein [Swingsia samuiensis]QDH17378.1 hypothetical protein E3D00_07245 [Swingsia samuiensis]